MKWFNKIALVPVAAASLVGSAFADVPAAVTTAMTGAGADGLTVVGGLATAGAAVFLIAKVLKKFGVMM